MKSCKNTILDGGADATPNRPANRRREAEEDGFLIPTSEHPFRPSAFEDLGTDAAPPVRLSARRGVPKLTKTRVPKIPLGDIWLDCDVAEYLHVSTTLVKRIVNQGPRPGELDLRKAMPVHVGDRRWFAENVKALVRNGGKMPGEDAGRAKSAKGREVA